MPDTYAINLTINVRRADGETWRAEESEIGEALVEAVEELSLEAGDHAVVYEIESAGLA